MILRKVSEFTLGSPTGGLLEAYRAIASYPDDYVELFVDQACELPVTIPLARPNLRLVFAAPVDCGTGTDVGFVLSALTFVEGRTGVLSVANTALSAFMLNPGADGSSFHGVSLDRYNRLNHNGHAGFFCNAPIANALERLTFDRCVANNGNGNGFRLGAGWRDSLCTDCTVKATKGQSAEGITTGGVNTMVTRCRIDRALTTGILVYCGPGEVYRNVSITDNVISNCSQAVLPPPLGIAQTGHNHAIAANCRDQHIYGLIVHGNRCYDDQVDTTGKPAPTQAFPLWLGNDRMGGTIEHLRLCSNVNWGDLSGGVPVAYVFGNQAAELVDAILT